MARDSVSRSRELAAIDQAAFALPIGAVSEPIKAATGTAIIRVLERKTPTPEEFNADKDRLKAELLNDRRAASSAPTW